MPTVEELKEKVTQAAPDARQRISGVVGLVTVVVLNRLDRAGVDLTDSEEALRAIAVAWLAGYLARQRPE